MASAGRSRRRIPLHRALQFGFSSEDEDVFERLIMPDSLAILKRAAQAANYNVKLTLGRGTKEVLIEAT